MLSSLEDLEAIRERLCELERRLAALEGEDGPHTAGGALARLTQSERRIVGLVVAGRTNDEIAQALFVSAKTVEWSRTKIYRKLRADGRGGNNVIEERARHAAEALTLDGAMCGDAPVAAPDPSALPGAASDARGADPNEERT